jgi:hypothetical protein
MAPWLDNLLSDYEELSPANGIQALLEGEKKLKVMVKDPEVFAKFTDHITDQPLILSFPAPGKRIVFLHNCFGLNGSLLGISGFAAISSLRSSSATNVCAGLVSDTLAPVIGSTLVPSVNQFLDCKTNKELLTIKGTQSTKSLQVGEFSRKPAVAIWTPALLQKIVAGNKPSVSALDFLSALVRSAQEKVKNGTHTVEQIETG